MRILICQNWRMALGAYWLHFIFSRAFLSASVKNGGGLSCLALTFGSPTIREKPGVSLLCCSPSEKKNGRWDYINIIYTDGIMGAASEKNRHFVAVWPSPSPRFAISCLGDQTNAVNNNPFMKLERWSNASDTPKASAYPWDPCRPFELVASC